jgi:hypothetical protein
VKYNSLCGLVHWDRVRAPREEATFGEVQLFVWLVVHWDRVRTPREVALIGEVQLFVWLPFI